MFRVQVDALLGVAGEKATSHMLFTAIVTTIGVSTCPPTRNNEPRNPWPCSFVLVSLVNRRSLLVVNVDIVNSLVAIPVVLLSSRVCARCRSSARSACSPNVSSSYIYRRLCHGACRLRRYGSALHSGSKHSSPASILWLLTDPYENGSCAVSDLQFFSNSIQLPRRFVRARSLSLTLDLFPRVVVLECWRFGVRKPCRRCRSRNLRIRSALQDVATPPGTLQRTRLDLDCAGESRTARRLSIVAARNALVAVCIYL